MRAEAAATAAVLAIVAGGAALIAGTPAESPLPTTLTPPPAAAPAEEAPARGGTNPSATGREPDRRDAEGPPPYDPQRLEGPDAKVGALEAHRLLQAIASRETTANGVQLGALNYLLDKLNPVKVTRGDAVAAARIADTLATWIEAHGAPFPKAADVLLPLVGQGPASLREAVVRALQALVRLEVSSGKPSATAEALAARLAGPQATESLVRDASRVLWHTAGKTLLAALIAGLLRDAEAIAGGPAVPREVYLEEIRSRVAVDFSRPEGWQKWWSEARELPLDKILAQAEERSREEYALNWRQVLRRLRDTGDAERFLLAVEDTLDGVRQTEVRLAAVVALEDFAEWSAGARSGSGAANEKAAPLEAAAPLREKAVRMLASLLEPHGSYAERPEVARAVLAALRKYHALLERKPALLADVSRIIVNRLQAMATGDRKPAREDLLETIRAAGVLRVTEALGLIETLLKDPITPGQEDLEVLTASVTALSRLGESGLRPDTARLLIALFRRLPASAEKPLRELRRATVSALAVGSDAEPVRKELLDLFQGVLAGGDRELRIPALLGLGTLARQKEARGFDALREVLEAPGQFEPQEIAAAIDAIAYVGGDAALAAFLQMLSRNQDQALEEHLFKKVLSLIEAGDLPALLAALEGIEDSAFALDSLRPLEFAAALGREPQVKELLSPGKLDLGNGARVELWGRAAMALLRVYDLLGDEEAVNASLAKLTEVVVKERGLKERFPRVAADLASFKTGVARRAAVLQKFARLEPEAAAALAADLAVLAAEGSVKERWCHLRWVARRLEGGLVPEAAARWREVWLACLRSGAPATGGKRDPWEGFPAAWRERYLARIQALATPPPTPPPGGGEERG